MRLTRIPVLFLFLFSAIVFSACGGSSERTPSLSQTEDSGGERRERRASREESEESGDEGAGESSKGGEAAAEASGKVALSHVEKDGRDYNLTINGVLAVKGVALRDGKYGEFLSFPAEERDGKTWDYIRMSRGDKEALLQAVKEEKVSGEPMGFSKVTAEVRLFDGGSGKTRGFVKFELDDGAVNLSSFKLIDGKNGIFLGTPREKQGDEWVDVVFPVDKAFRKQLVEAAKKGYEEAGGDPKLFASDERPKDSGEKKSGKDSRYVE